MMGEYSECGGHAAADFGERRAAEEVAGDERFDSSPIWRYARRKHAGAHLVSRAAALVSRDHPHDATLLRCGFFPGPHRFKLQAQSVDARIELHRRRALPWASTDHA